MRAFFAFLFTLYNMHMVKGFGNVLSSQDLKSNDPLMKAFVEELVANALSELRTTVDKQAKTISKLQSTVNRQVTKLTNLQSAVRRHEAMEIELLQKLSRQEARIAVLESSRAPQEHANTSVKYTANNGIQRIRNAPDIPVAFTAVKMASQANIGVNQNILFDNVILNEGNGYHSQHGIFIAPINGLYLITATLLHSPINQYFHAAIMHQGNEIARLHGTINIYDASTQTVILRVTAGEEIWVRSVDYVNENVVGGRYSSFSGYLLMPTE
ncbi:C1QT3-like protein [Mya arenaria]|uniref:C1QT3-like protein n=1 Tax=Mya arenaria TaxID=6604 RepID=A0ABY7FAF9_MYAAR|nr:uncharacterized protein LOC128207563 [Mya arenaria]WAR19158.1 C1QT3-like protein [Mya arenaria]